MFNLDKEIFFQMEYNLEKRANKLGGIVRLMRETAELSQEQLAEQLYMSTSAISKIEHNHQKLDVETMREIIRVTKCGELALVYLFGLEGVRMLDGMKKKIQD